MKHFVTLMIVAVFLSMTACNQHTDKKNEKTSDTQGKHPVMAFTETVHDFGNMVRGEIVKYKFHFKNVGNADLRIFHVQTTCGCTVGKYPQEAIPPGGEGDLDVTFNSTFKEGYQDKSIMIVANQKN